jgi:hypothetical protein
MDLIASINFFNPTWDLFILLFFFIAAFIYGLSLGRDRVLVILVSIYMGLGIVTYAPFLNEVAGQPLEVGVDRYFVIRVGAFITAFLLLFFLLSRSALTNTIASSDEPGKWWQVIVFSVLHVGLLVSVVLSFLPANSIDQLAPFTQRLFVDELPRFIWFIAPIVVMAFTKKPKKSSAKSD